MEYIPFVTSIPSENPFIMVLAETIQMGIPIPDNITPNMARTM